MQDVVVRTRGYTLRRLVRYGATGLAVGGVVGYLGALVLPRRYPAREGTYEAPVPVRFVPKQRAGDESLEVTAGAA